MTASAGHDTDTARRLRRQLADRLTETGSTWHEAFAGVPRHLFTPSFMQQNAQGDWETVAATDPGYLEAVYSDVALTTQLTGGAPTSSTSQPSLMLSMLEALELRDGQRVLELGTGTGYHAALLSHRLGQRNVTTVDVDPRLTGRATERLALAGYRPSVHTGDGFLGVAERAPFDRIIATCCLLSVPWPCIEQAADDAVIVVPIGQGIARLAVHGETAEGRFLPGGASFMRRRSDIAVPNFAALANAEPEGTQLSVTSVLDRLSFPLSLALSGYASCTWSDEETGDIEAVGLWTPDGSVARAHVDGTVHQSGPQRLWHTVEQVYRLFPDAPSRNSFGLTLSRQAQRVWFGDPDGPGWELPVSAPLGSRG